jgi:anti-anti-sigma factor
VTVVRNHHTAHIVLRGEFDTPEVEHLARLLTPLLDDPPELVVLGLANVGFMCSSTLTELVRLREACTRAAADLVVSDSSHCASRLIEVAGLAGYLGLDAATEPAR